jgi:uncharacterized membrane protein
MQFFPGVLSPGLVGACIVLAAWLLALVWPELRAVLRRPQRLHLVLGTAVALAVLWSVHARIEPISFHLLGTPAAVLLLGWRLGVFAAALAEAALLALGGTSLGAAPAGWLLSAAFPGLVIVSIAWATRFYLPRNPFVFIFACAFFGSALALFTTWLGAELLLGWAGQATPGGPNHSLLSFMPLAILPEAFINGAIMSVLVIYRPEWVRLYDEAYYARA